MMSKIAKFWLFLFEVALNLRSRICFDNNLLPTTFDKLFTLNKYDGNELLADLNQHMGLPRCKNL